MLGNVSLNIFGSKPTPSPKDAKLPALPPSDLSDNTSSSAPPPPPKSPTDAPGMSQSANNRLPPIDTSSLSPNDGIQIAPITPISPIGLGSSLPSSPGPDGQKKKTNPLTDFVETEKVYVELLTGIIRKVASAWSRQNLPPPELDKMFRSIESIYKANRALLGKLKDIGTDPSSLKALGDLLQKWIVDLEPPYTKYCTNYCTGYDVWEPMQSNERLRTTLAMFSSTNPPPSAQEHPAEPPLWTLDELFLLPKNRLRYYRKLYSRLLKNTTPGRSDHRLLASGIEKLDSLLVSLEARSAVRVGGAAPPPIETEDEVVIDLRTRDSTLPLPPPSHRASDSTRGSDSPGVGRSSQDTAPTSVERGSTSTLDMPVTDLERRLSTDRTLDIFTMQPKQVRLQIIPPGLHYTRELRISQDVVLNLIPRSTGVEITQERGHVFLLTDLLLICEKMTPQEMARSGPDGADMWLLYPPLAGKHLRVAAVEGSDTALTVTILRKEVVTMYCESRPLRDKLVAEFWECIDRAALLQPGKNQPPPPPVPQLPPSLGLSNSPASFHSPQGVSNASNSPPMRAFSPGAGRAMSPPTQVVSGMRLSDEQYESNTPSRTSSLSAPSSPYPPRAASAASAGPGTSFSVGQVVPPGPGSLGPGRGMPPPSSFGPGQIMSPTAGPGQVFPPPRGTSYRPPGQPGLSAPPGAVARSTSPYGHPASRPPSDGSMGGASLRTSTSSRSLGSQFDRGQYNGPQPPMPGYPDGLAPPNRPFMQRSDSSGSLNNMGLQAPQPRPLLPSAQFSVRSISTASFCDPSPPSSPVQETQQFTGPTSSNVTAQMKCKVFLQEHHAKWKSMGSGRLKVYHESPTNIKQLVVEADSSKKAVMISTIVLEDGVERVGKTGVAIELSDKGQRTGVVYMIQLRTETSAGGLFDSLLAGSDRSVPNSRS